MTISSAIQMLEERIERGVMEPGERRFLRQLRSEIDNGEPMPVGLPEKVESILDEEGITHLEFTSMSIINSELRGRILCRIRNEIEPRMSWPAIGKCFGVSHSTVMTSAKRYAAKHGLGLR